MKPREPWGKAGQGSKGHERCTRHNKHVEAHEYERPKVRLASVANHNWTVTPKKNERGKEWGDGVKRKRYDEKNVVFENGFFSKKHGIKKKCF